jgi:hypothetical protein
LKKISSIQELEIKKQQLKKYRDGLGNEIQVNWKELKQMFRPENLLSEAIIEGVKNRPFSKADEPSLLNTAFSFGLNLFSKIKSTAR